MVLSTSDLDVIEFTVKCKMRRRWAKQFLGMLKLMQHLGGVGSSRKVTLFADGDGDFRPKFEISETLEYAEPFCLPGEHYYFDAG